MQTPKLANTTPTRPVAPLLGGLLLLFAAASWTGITWGLPSRQIDPLLFGEGRPWTGERIYALAGTGWGTRDIGADVDLDPLQRGKRDVINLTADDAAIARILLRYRLYTYQPDEMIVMRALAQMKPAQLDFDPRLYQYGGLFLYPVGAGIRLAAAIGWIDVRSDIPYYLDHPDAFGRFYLVSRGYAAIWGLAGVLVVFGIGRRLEGNAAGLLAALLYTILPVVVCMSHEGKPHLPGAVLMLLAVYLAIRTLKTEDPATPTENSPGAPRPNRLNPMRSWWLMCGVCGASVGMVLSCAPILVLIPLVAWLRRPPGPPPVDPHTDPTDTQAGAADSPNRANGHRWIVACVAGLAIAAAVYLLSNPYVAINIFANREVLRSNFGNSLAMYQVAKVAAGALRVTELIGQGTGIPVAVLGCLAGAFAIAGRRRDTLPLIVPAGVFFVQFALIGAGKPAEYGRFAVFLDTLLAIGTACLIIRLAHRFARLTWTTAILAVIVILPTATGGWKYLSNFRADAGSLNTRTILGVAVPALIDANADADHATSITLAAEPAPYNCPPLPFERIPIFLAPDRTALASGDVPLPTLLLAPVDRPPADPASASPPVGDIIRRVGGMRTSAAVTPISWANKPFQVLLIRTPDDALDAH